MTFSRSEPTFHYPQLRLISSGGCWELGMGLYASGMRLRMGRCGRPPSVLDFCMGMDERLYAPIFAAVLRRLEGMADDSTDTQIDGLFPWAGTRPDLSKHLEPLLSAA